VFVKLFSLHYTDSHLSSFTSLFYFLAVSKAAFGALPVAAISAPAFAMDSIIEALPSNTVALEVQFGAYLAVLLGTILPVLFLINLFIQTESRKAGAAGGEDSA
jgi:photosystem II PsbM protein